jgi:hypothetical protein
MGKVEFDFGHEGDEQKLRVLTNKGGVIDQPL